jgi:hypothetical protein
MNRAKLQGFEQSSSAAAGSDYKYETDSSLFAF